MEEPNRNETTVIEIKEELNEENVLDEVENNCKISRDKQSRIVEHQQQQDYQQQPEMIEIKRELIIDHQINSNEPETIAEQIPSCSPNFDYPGYPGFIEAIRQAKGKKKSHDVSFQMPFLCYSDSVIRQHDIHLNEWWNYCLIEKKDPLETDLSVFIGYLEKKLDAGTSHDDFKSIASSVCLIASDKMASQIHSLSFLFLEYAKYSPTNNTNGYKTPKLSCQNNSVKLSLHSETKKQDESKISSVQIENVQKAKLSEVIDISDDHSGNQSPSTSMKKQTNVLNNDVPTTSKNKSVLLQKATNNSQTITPLMKSPSTKPPAVKKSILPELIDLSDDDSDTESPSTSLQKDVLNNNDQSNYEENDVFIEQVIDNSQLVTPLMESSTPTTKPSAILLHSQKKVSENNVNEEPLTRTINGPKAQWINEPEDNPINQQSTIENTPLGMPTKSRMNDVVIDTESSSSNKKYPTIPIPFVEQEQNEAIQQSQSRLPPSTPLCQFNTSGLECSSNNVETGGNSQSGLLVDTIQRERQQQQHQLLSANNEAIGSPRKTLTSGKLPLHYNTPLLSQCQINEGALECLSQELKETKTEPTENLQSELLSGNTVEKQQQQHQLPSAKNNQAIDLFLNDNATLITSSVSTSLPEKSEQLMNLDKSNTNSIPELSDRSVNSNSSYNEMEATSNTEGYEFLQEAIDNPLTTVVQHQIEGNTVKILVVEPKGEQRLITFDMPNEECTLNDLFEQASVPFNETTIVTLVKDRTLKINYIVESETGTIADSTETSDVNDELLNDDNVLSDEKCLQDDNGDNNIHATSTVNIEEPKYIDGKSARCNHCRFLSIDFNRCFRCKKKIKYNPITEPCTPVQKEYILRDMVSINKYYKNLLNNDTCDDDEDHNDDDDDDIKDDHDSYADDGGNDDDDDDWCNNGKKNTRKKEKVQSTLLCRTVEIGSYKYTPKEHVVINTYGLILSVPLLEDETKIVEVHVKHRHIAKVLIHSGNQIPILVFYTNRKSASKIRKLLGMNNPKGPYYDPAGKNQTHQRIILFPISLKSNSIMILKKLFPYNNVMHQELTAKEVDDIIFSRGASLEDSNNSSSNIDNRQTTIANTNNTNNIVKNLTIHPAASITNNNNSQQVTSLVTIEKPKYVDGKCAVCRSCGDTSMDFNRCYGCKKKIPNNPKTKLDITEIEQKINMTLLIGEFYESLANNNTNINDFDIDISPHEICSTSKSENSLSHDKNNTTDSDYNSDNSIENETNNNNKRKRLQLEVTAEEKNSNKVLPSMPWID